MTSDTLSKIATLASRSPKNLMDCANILGEIKALATSQPTTPAAPAAAKPKPAPVVSAMTDEQLVGHYNALTGTDRKTFLKANAPALWRAQSRLARAKKG